MPAADMSSFNTRIELQQAPIHPHWIVERAPVARNRTVAGSSDHSAWTMMWDCTAGRFNWIYQVDETVHVIEGGVTVTVAGNSRSLGPGDIAFFPAGTVAQWHVENYIRKLAFCHKPAPALVGVPLRLMRRALRQIGKGMALVEGSLADPLPQSGTRTGSEELAPARIRART